MPRRGPRGLSSLSTLIIFMILGGLTLEAQFVTLMPGAVTLPRQRGGGFKPLNLFFEFKSLDPALHASNTMYYIVDTYLARIRLVSSWSVPLNKLFSFWYTVWYAGFNF